MSGGDDGGGVVRSLDALRQSVVHEVWGEEDPRTRPRTVQRLFGAHDGAVAEIIEDGGLLVDPADAAAVAAAKTCSSDFRNQDGVCIFMRICPVCSGKNSPILRALPPSAPPPTASMKRCVPNPKPGL